MGLVPASVRSRTRALRRRHVKEAVEARVEAKVHELAEALKPRLRGVLHEAAFAISLVTGTALVCLADAGRARHCHYRRRLLPRHGRRRPLRASGP